MSNNKMLFLILCLFYAAVYVSCDFEKPMHENVDQVYYFPMYTYEVIELPEHMVQSPDSMAQVAVKFVLFSNKLKEYADLLAVPFDSINTGLPWIKSYFELNGLRTTLTIREIEDSEQFEWNLTKSGIDTFSSETYNDWLFVRGSWGRESDIAHLMIFDNNSTSYLASVYHSSPTNDDWLHFSIWTTVDSLLNNFSISRSKNENFILNDFSFNSRIYYEIDTLDYQINWNNDGEGYWYARNDANEIVIDGSWK